MQIYEPTEKVNIRIKYFDADMPRIEKLEVGDWIDLRAAKDVRLWPFRFVKLPLGIAMELPDGYEAYAAPRGSTFKNYGVIQVNSPGVVDESYKGDNDEWFIPLLSFRFRKIKKGDRICQFRIQKKQPRIDFVTVDHLDNPDRGGYGSTGRK